MSHQFTSVDEYIQSFPSDVQTILKELRRVISEALPEEAKEVISYNAPTYKLHDSYVIYFAGYKEHVSIYPIPRDPVLHNELAPYESGKGTLRFPLDKPVPYDLVKKVTKALTKDNEERTGH